MRGAARSLLVALTPLSRLDCNPRQNLASFVTTWMEPEAEALMASAANGAAAVPFSCAALSPCSLAVNMVDIEQYPSSKEFEERCVCMLANLFNAPAPPPGGKFMGAATIGSSEAIMLAGLAMKRRWQMRRRAAGLSTDKPNLVMGHNRYICPSLSGAL